jgi:hypothetical protein
VGVQAFLVGLFLVSGFRLLNCHYTTHEIVSKLLLRFVSGPGVYLREISDGGLHINSSLRSANPNCRSKDIDEGL